MVLDKELVMCLPYHKKKLLFETLWKYSYLITFLLIKKPYSMNKFEGKYTSVINGFKNMKKLGRQALLMDLKIR